MSTKDLLDRILCRFSDESFAVRYWDGALVSYGLKPPEFVLHLKDEQVCRGLLTNLDVGFGEAYVSGAIEVEGNLQALMRLVFLPGHDGLSLGLGEKVRLALAGWRWPNPLAQARANVAPHYDLGNEFFRLWLGKEMAYSCAYFRSPEDDLDAAQEQKFEHICAKLRLRPDEQLLDIGCGWGGFLLHAARHYGVRGVGVTLSREQKKEAEQRVAAHALSDRVTIHLKDYRELPEGIGFDKIVSIGMYEHVGTRNVPEYFRHTMRLMKLGGVGVLHTIGRHRRAPANPWLTKYIFPGAHFPSLAEIARPLSESGFIITDVEVLRWHYALTLGKWIDAYEANIDKIRQGYGERFSRIWRLYLNSCAASFRYGDFCVWQIQFTKGLDADIPLTRDYLYREC